MSISGDGTGLYARGGGVIVMLGVKVMMGFCGMLWTFVGGFCHVSWIGGMFQ